MSLSQHCSSPHLPGPWPNLTIAAAGQRSKTFLADKGVRSGDRKGEGKTEWGEQHKQGEKGRRKRRRKRQAWCGLCPTGAVGHGGPQHACADLELGVLCLAEGVPGPSSCSISGSMTEGCSGFTALLPWRVEWGVAAGSRWELEVENRKNTMHSSSQVHHSCSGNSPRL